VNPYIPTQTQPLAGTTVLDMPFTTAQEILLAPYSLDDQRLQTVFGEIMTHRVDYADLYFQYSRNESWSLEEGIVKSGSFNIDQGVGVRAVSGEKTAFAYSDDISLTALKSAAEATRAIARSGQSGGVQVVKRGTGRNLYAAHDPLVSLADRDKVELLERLERYARSLDPRVTQVMAWLAGEGRARRPLRWAPRRRREAARALLDPGDCRAGRTPGAGRLRRRRPFRLRLFHGRGAAGLRP
jgi:hypothetical protein